METFDSHPNPVSLLHEFGHEKHHAPAQKASCRDPGDRAGHSEKEAFTQKKVANLGARHSQSAEYAYLDTTLRYAYRECVKDDEEPDQQRHDTGEKQPLRKSFHQALGLFASSQRGFDSVPRAQSGLDAQSRVVNPGSLLKGDIDTVERPAAAENELGRIDIHDADVSAKSLRHPAWSHDPPDGEGLVPHCGDQLQGVVFLQVIPGGKFSRDDDAVRL